MPTKANPRSTPSAVTDDAVRNLAMVLGQSEQVKELVEQSAQELSSVNAELRQATGLANLPPDVAQALQKSAAIISKVQDASEHLAQVNEILAQELDTIQGALHDPLTGLPTRALFDDRLAQGLAQSERSGSALALMLISLGDYRKINAEHGHAVGEAVLQTMADRLVENTRAADSLCHLHGDEFLFLVMETGEAALVAKLAEKICATLQKPCSLSVGTLAVRPSLGIALFPQDGITAEQLLNAAGEALQRARLSPACYAFPNDLDGAPDLFAPTSSTTAASTTAS